jgi:hypothetical protein
MGEKGRLEYLIECSEKGRPWPFSETESEKRGFRFPSLPNRLRDWATPYLRVREARVATVRPRTGMIAHFFWQAALRRPADDRQDGNDV